MRDPASGASAIGRQTFLFLQGPLSPMFERLADELEARGHWALRVNLCFGDSLLWRRRGALNYRGPIGRWPAYVRELISREGVTDLILLGEQRPHHRLAIEAARASGVRVTVTDFGYLRPDWIVLERDGMSAWSRFPREPAAILRLAADSPAPDLSPLYADSFLRQAVWDIVYHLSSWLLSPLYPGYRSHQIHHPVPNYLGTALRLMRRRWTYRAAERTIREVRASGRPYWLFLMQMEVDYSIRAYSPYPDMSAPLRETLDAFARGAPPDGVLLVKLHPLDPGLRPWTARLRRWAREAGVEGRVRFLDGGALDPLVATAAGVVTVNSTAGLRALQLGRPVKVLGSALYDVRGLTYAGPLEHFWRDGVPPDPGLLDGFVRAVADLLHVRGVYYREPGLTAAVRAAADRLEAPVASALAARLAAATGPAASAGARRIYTAAQH